VSFKFLGAFAKLRRATITFVMSVRPSACNNSARTGRIFIKFDIWGFFRKSVEKIQVSLNSDKNKGYCTWRPIYIFLTYLAHLFLEWEMMQTKVVEKIKTHFAFINFFFFRKWYRLWENVEEYCRARQATDNNTAHAHFMLDNSGYKHALRICNTYWFPLPQWLHERSSMLCYVIRTLPVLLGFRSNAAEVSAVTGHWCPTFRDSVGGLMFRGRNVHEEFLSDAAPHIRKASLTNKCTHIIAILRRLIVASDLAVKCVFCYLGRRKNMSFPFCSA